uniref:Uncharacterized protein n=1 Tax=Timema shepardi TaxID=629360 RepID=A0A7R9G265_TIMSH|nr:unnamed protein product [Timema shepardi]
MATKTRIFDVAIPGNPVSCEFDILDHVILCAETHRSLGSGQNDQERSTVDGRHLRYKGYFFLSTHAQLYVERNRSLWDIVSWRGCLFGDWDDQQFLRCEENNPTHNPKLRTTMAVFLARADAIVMSRGAYGMYINIEHEEKEGQANMRNVTK